MRPMFKVSQVYGLQTQRLRNVAILTPSLFKIRSGRKRLFWQDDVLEFDSSTLLLTKAGQQLTFENEPSKERFLSVQMSFLLPPAEDMIQLSIKVADNECSPRFKPNRFVMASLDFLLELDTQSVSETTQAYWLNGFYQQLAEAGKLHLIFEGHAVSFEQKITELLQQAPWQDYQLDQVAAHFSMSRATLIRRLKEENTQFRTLLTRVRMNYALSLMQQGYRQQIDIAVRCGYQSQERFSQRFYKSFGITPSQYIKTL